jgi:hypothetical protein
LRRGPRNQLPTQLAEGEIGFATDTGELFIGAPNLSSTSYITPAPLSRSDQNIRILTELDSVAQSNIFSEVSLPVGNNQTTIYEFNMNDNFAIMDYALTDNSLGPIVTSTLWMVITDGANIIHDNSFASSDITFTISYINYIPTLQCVNHIDDELTLSYKIRSWTSVASSSVICRAILKGITSSITIVVSNE